MAYQENSSGSARGSHLPPRNSTDRGGREPGFRGRSQNSRARGRGGRGHNGHKNYGGPTRGGHGEDKNNGRGGHGIQRGGRGRGGGERREFTPRPMTYGRLKTWAESSDAAELIMFMCSEGQQIQTWLNEDRVKEDWFTLFVKALDFAFNAQHHKESIRQIIAILGNTHFFEHFVLYLTEKEISGQPWQDAEDFCKSCMHILGEILDKMPGLALKCVNATSHLLNCTPCESELQITRELKDNLVLMIQRAKSVLVSERQKEQRLKRGSLLKTDDSDVPPDDFKELSVVPTESDLDETCSLFVRGAIVKGAYDNTLHYLDVQFRLMKADFLLPLKNGLAEYKERGCRENFTCSDIRLYFNVKIIDIIYSGGIHHVLHFDVSKLRNVRWEFSKRLIFGSLVCLSKDNFKTVVFATIAGRDRQSLKEGYVNVSFKSGLDEVFNSTANDIYIMAETTAYFESYIHVLEGLQEMTSTLPLQEYIVKCSPVLKPPKYLLPSGGIGSLPEYDIHFMMKKDRQKIVPVLTTVRWPKADEMCLNESQREAVQLALTKEIAIIQGPPGTGKTYVGLKVMQALIENKDVIAGGETGKTNPILVVCYTNHALDQFLEGVLEFCKDGIIRVGGKNHSELLEPFTIRTLRQKIRKEQILNSTSVRRMNADCNRELDMITSEIKELQEEVNTLMTEIKYEKILESHMKSMHGGSLVDDKPDQMCSRSVLKVWLNASDSNPQTVIPQMIELHLTKLVLQWAQPSAKLFIRAGMNIIERAKCYCMLKMLKQREICQERDFLLSCRPDSSVKMKIQQIENLLADSETRILYDEELSMPESCFIKLTEQLNSEFGAKDSVLRGSLFRFWLLGSHRGLHKQLDDIEMLTNALKGEQEDTIDFDDEDVSNETHGQRIIDDDDENQSSDYKQKTEDAKNGLISIMQRIESLGIQDLAQDDSIDEGWQYVKHSKPLSFSQVAKKLSNIKPMTELEENCVTNVWKLDQKSRYALYNLWIARYREKLTQKMSKMVDRYKSMYEMKKEVNREEDIYLLSNAKVIGMTTTGAAKHRAVLQAVGCKIVIVEEAAEVLESHIVTSLNKNCQHLILIGDHQQLRPSPTVYRLAKDYGLEISLFERLINNKVPHVVLKEQHRMRPQISQLMRHIYPDLQDHDSVHDYDSIAGVSENMFFIQHEEKEVKVDDTRSKANIHEASYLVALCQYLLQQGYEPRQITILATYAGQVLAIKKVMKEQNFRHSVRVTAVDNYQGEENEIILLSLVRSNTENDVGFLKVDNRVCVALSRAKRGLYVIGNIESLSTQSKLWASICQTAKRTGTIGEGLPVVCQNHPDFKTILTSLEDFQKCPEGGCSLPCDYRLTCGHICARKCHGYDRDHSQYKCWKLCTKTCIDGHPCLKKCSQVCGHCLVPVMKTIPSCGHDDKIPCYIPLEKAVCSQKCPVLLDCEHPCPGTCGQCRKNGQHEKCIQNAEYSWPCGHICKVPCYMKPSMYPCQSECGAVLDCGHKCQGKCGECLQGAVHVACGKTCNKILPCGHLCHSYCGVPCLPCNKECPGKCVHGSCAKSQAATSCGQACILCKEHCSYKCKHGQCTKLCHEVCDVKPCNKPCGKKVPHCQHDCFGLCGEHCVCAKCDEVLVLTPAKEITAKLEPNASLEKSKEMDSQEKPVQSEPSVEVDPQSVKVKDQAKKLLIKIPSCSHVFYVDELDHYVSSYDLGGSKYIECPKCQKPILNCWRYETINKERSLRREVGKSSLKRENHMSKEQIPKLVRSLKQIEKSILLRKFQAKTDQMMNKIDVVAKSFQLKCAFVLREIHSLDDKDSLSSTHVTSLKNYLLKIDGKLTTQQQREVIGELTRFYWLKYLSHLQREGSLHEVLLPESLDRDVRTSLEALEQLKPEPSQLERSQKVAEILVRYVKEMVTEPVVKAKCMLLEESCARVVQILHSNNDQMLCDLIDSKAEESKKDRISQMMKGHHLTIPAKGAKPLEPDHGWRAWDMDKKGSASLNWRHVEVMEPEDSASLHIVDSLSNRTRSFSISSSESHPLQPDSLKSDDSSRSDVE